MSIFFNLNLRIKEKSIRIVLYSLDKIGVLLMETGVSEFEKAFSKFQNELSFKFNSKIRIAEVFFKCKGS